MPYEEVEEKLWLTAKLYDCDALHIECYKFLLDNYFQYERASGKGLIVDEFADEHRTGIYLLRIDSHLTCCIDDTIFDIWDCRFDGIVTDAWRVE